MYILTLLFSTLSVFLYSQISFYKAFSDQGYDKAEGVVQLADSSYLITGSSSSFGLNQDAYILKIDSLGNRLWSHHYGGNEADKGRRIFHIPNDGIYVFGQSFTDNSTFFDPYFFKTDEQGNLLIEKRLELAAYQDITDAIMLKDSSFIAVGYSNEIGTQKNDLFMMRMNRFGDTLWTKTWGSNENDQLNAITLLNDSTVILAGQYFVQDSLLLKGYLASYHINGTENWSNVYGIAGEAGVNDVIFNNNEIYAVGFNRNDAVNNSKNFIFKTDINGVNLRETTEQHFGDLSFNHIIQVGPNTNEFYIICHAENSLDIATYEDGNDVLIFKFDNFLNFVFVSFYPSNIGEDFVNDLIKTSDNGAIAVGLTEYPINGGLNSSVIKIGPNDQFNFNLVQPSIESLVQIQNITKNNFYLYPNPTKEKIYFSEISKFKLYSTIGHLIIEGQSTELDLSNFSPGNYFLEIVNNKYKIVKMN